MYSENELPMFDASVFYYDNVYSIETSEKVLSILKKHGFFPPDKIYADVLTKNRFISSDYPEEIFIQAYGKDNVMSIDMASGDSRKVKELWRIHWIFTFFKDKNLQVKNPVFKPWNIFMLQSTYGLLKSDEYYNNFLDCVKEVISVLSPFYAQIDDIANNIDLLEKTKEKYFIPERIRQIYWGNYFTSAQKTNH